MSNLNISKLNVKANNLMKTLANHGIVSEFTEGSNEPNQTYPPFISIGDNMTIDVYSDKYAVEIESEGYSEFTNKTHMIVNLLDYLGL